MRDFTLEKYEKICQVIAKNYQTKTFEAYLTSNSDGNFVILRHDVDRMAANALETAKIEHKYGLKASYYFRVTKGSFKPEIIKEIARLGHEIGYHYECLDAAKGDNKIAIQIFQNNLKKFAKISNIKTICMHGNPLSKWDNRDLWKKYNFKDYGILGETYLTMGSDIVYFSDTGRTWSNKFKVKDFPLNQKIEQVEIETTNDLIELIKNKQYSKICLLTHPERWSKSFLGWVSYGALDFAVRLAKKARKK